MYQRSVLDNQLRVLTSTMTHTAAVSSGKTGSPELLQQVIDSITKKLLVLPDDTAVYPGQSASSIIRSTR